MKVQVWFVAILVSAITVIGISVKSLAEEPMRSLGRANVWLNSQPLSARDLRGRVVLIDFWTYTCINWRRTLPYLRAWEQKYKDQGLVIIGVHTPEFGFEKNVDNVRVAAMTQKVDYPIVIDSDYSIWNAFGNHYWPALYVIDAQGRIRHHQFGEGEYEKSEGIIQQLLTEAGHNAFDRAPVSVDAQGAEAAADRNDLGTPETYVGYAQAENFASPGEELRDRPRVYVAPARLKLNEWALAGDWTMRKESALLNTSNGKISYRFHARDLHLIMGCAVRGRPVRFRVLIEGQPPGTSHAADIDDEGFGAINEPRMYQLIRQPGPIEDRQVEVEFLDPGVEVYDFTFG